MVEETAEETATGDRGNLLPPTYWFGCALLMVVLHALFPLVRWAEPPVTYLGFVFIAAAVALAGWAGWTFRRYGTTVHPFEPTARLVTDGPYRYARNPMYLGLMIALVGVLFLLGSVTPIVVVVIFEWIISTRFIEPEEQALERKYGEAFRSYKSRVRRWI